MATANVKKAQSTFSNALRRIRPSAKETQKNFEAAGQLIKKLQSAVPSGVEIELAGSLAKGTNLAGKNEFDIFVLFPRHYSHHEMCMLGLSYARRAFAGMKTESRYAEHPYLQVFHGDFHADIVPAYRISHIGEKGSSVDRSQLHTQFVNSKLGAKGKEDVRLLKTFMKNFGIYGAELRVEGFSGYLCELLIIQYGSLMSLMGAAASWKEPSLDPTGKHSHEQMRQKFNSPLIAIDPVDPNRNVAAVVAQTSLSRFIFECRRFLKAPSEKFFFSQKTVRSTAQIRKALKERGTYCLAVQFPAPKVVADILWPQLKKTAHALSSSLSDSDFSVFGCYHWSDGNECVILFELDRWELPAVRKALGPNIKFASDVDAFVKKHSGSLNLHLEHDKIVAVEKRGVTDAKDALMQACKKAHGVPENMAKSLGNCRISDASALLKRKYAEFLSDYFFAKIA